MKSNFTFLLFGEQKTMRSQHTIYKTILLKNNSTVNATNIVETKNN
jgi:hypothetical protein